MRKKPIWCKDMLEIVIKSTKVGYIAETTYHDKVLLAEGETRMAALFFLEEAILKEESLPSSPVPKE